jgi:tetratricopeptide (TPR) repeat protein
VRAILPIVAAFALVGVGPATAQDEVEAPAAPAKADPASLGTLELELTPGARITTDPHLSNGVFRISLWRQKGAIGPQVSRARLDVLRSFHTVPYSRYALRLDLRLTPDVKGVDIQRDGDKLLIVFTDRRFAGHSVRLQTRRVQEALDRRRNQEQDALLAEVLEAPMTAAEPFVDQSPVLWPVGSQSPVRPLIQLDPRPRRVPRPPVILRETWAASDVLSKAVILAEGGELEKGIRSLAGLPMPDDDVRAVVAALRGHIYSLPVAGGEPWSPGRSASAFVLASALRPEASWAPWARGMAGYGYERESNFIEAELQYRLAAEMAPEAEERVFWELGRGASLIQSKRVGRGLGLIRDFAGRLRAADHPMLFELRRSVAWGLWKDGEYAQAAAVADMTLAEHPTLARAPEFDYFWVRIFMDAGRSAPALPFLERLLADGERVWRERARWWMHESALQHRDVTESRRRLKQIIDETPGSTLTPLAQTRMLVLDAIATGGKGDKLTWQVVSLALREKALEWPNTIVEGEALSLTAQLWLELGLVQDAVNMYAWIEERNPGYRGPIARDEFMCRAAPRAFRELRALGEVTRALGIYRGFLDDPTMHGCIDPQIRNDAAQAATVAGLPDLAARWLGQAVAEGTSGLDESNHLVALADIYVQQGKVDAADQTLDYLLNSDLPLPNTSYLATRGDVYRMQERWVDALEAYDGAVDQAAASVRSRKNLPVLHYHRGLTLESLEEYPRALVELQLGVEQGGAEDPVLGWLMVAAVGVRVAGDKAAWQGVLDAVNKAQEGAPGDSRARALQYYRATALEGLGQAADADKLLASLADGTDAWALRAREHRSRGGFDASVDARVKPKFD